MSEADEEYGCLSYHILVEIFTDHIENPSVRQIEKFI